jgi:hypothetical protein
MTFSCDLGTQPNRYTNEGSQYMVSEPFGPKFNCNNLNLNINISLRVNPHVRSPGQDKLDSDKLKLGKNLFVKIIKTKTAILRLIPNIITFPKLILQKKK